MRVEHRHEWHFQDLKARSAEKEERLNRVEQIEEAIVKLYMEMKDRSTEIVKAINDSSKMIDDEKEKQRLRKESPLVVLDMLKGCLRTLLAFKEDYEDELKEQIRSRKKEIDDKVNELRKDINKLESEKEDFKQSAIKAIQVKDEAVTSKRDIIEESNQTILQMKKGKLYEWGW